MNNQDIIITIKENIGNVIVGRQDTVDLLLTALIADGHVLLEDVPGTGKTLLAKALAKSLALVFRRLQFTPDLLPSDVTGLNFFNQKEGKFILQQGPVFTNILLADEINRATPRTQSSLLEAMEERQVTIDGTTYLLADPFFVIATQNPVDTAGTFPLPEAQMDRFLMRISMGHLSREEELAILDRFGSDNPLNTLEPVCQPEDLDLLRKASAIVYVHPVMKDYIVSLVQATREENQILDGVSPRGTLALYRAVRAYALIRGRDYVVPEDIKELAVPVLAHRLTTAASFGLTTSGKDLMERILAAVPVPTEDWSARL